MTKKPINTSFTLTQPELLFMLRLLELPDLPGMGEKPWGDIPVEQAEKQFQEAGQALQSRGLVAVNDQQQPTADRGLIQSLQCAAYPERMSSLAWRADSGAVAQVHHYRRGEAFVRQHSQDGNHSLTLAEHSDMGQEDMLAVFQSPGWPSPQGRGFELPAALYEQAADLAGADRPAAEALLVGAGLDKDLAARLATCFQTGKRRANLRWVHQLSPSPAISAITVWTSAESVWVVETDGQTASGRVRLLPVDGQLLNRIIIAGCQSLLGGQVQGSVSHA